MYQSNVKAVCLNKIDHIQFSLICVQHVSEELAFLAISQEYYKDVKISKCPPKLSSLKGLPEAGVDIENIPETGIDSFSRV